jgi:hypothetical protein
VNKARLGTALIAALAAAAFGGSRTAALPAAFDLKIAVFETAPKIDGVLEPEIWNAATRMESFTQYLPTEGAAPSEQTIGYIGCDRDSLYLAFRCFDSNPRAVRASLTPRDQSRGDDGIRIFIDTFNAKKNAFVFEVNPRGIQNDGIYTEVRRMGYGGFDMYDRNWDTFFLADARIDNQGYVVEIAIPFKSLRFPATPVQTWGFQVQRTIKRKNEEIFWHPRTRDVSGFLIQAGEIEFEKGIGKGKNIEVMPVVTASKVDNGRIEPQAGFNLKYGLTSDMTADLTVNPDFSQIEADIPQVAVNQRYPLYYPEKRPFFLEGKELFDTPFELNYTRQIVDPIWGVKLTGTAGRTTIGFLSAMDENAPIIDIPGVADGVFNETGNRSWVNVFRIRREVFSESYLGAVFSNKEIGRTGSGLFDNYSRVAGVDGSFKFAEYNRFSFQFVGSQNKAGTETTALVPAATVSLAHQSRHFSASLEWTYLPPDFEAGLGFFNRKDINSVSARAGYSFLPQTNLLISITPTIDYMRIHDFSRTLTDDKLSLGFRLNGWRQTNVFFDVSTGLERYEGVDFRGTEAFLGLSTEPFSWMNFFVMGSVGDGIYYSDDPYQGWKSNFGFRITLNPSSSLRLSYNIDHDAFFTRRGGENVYRINLVSQRISYQISRPLSVRWITDWDDYYKTLYLSFLVAVEFRPGTVFYFGIEDNREQDEHGIFRGTGRYYFVKFSYWWRT